MNSIDLFKMGFHNLWRKKTRTFLTVLGVVIGTSSIVVMLSLGIAMDQSFQEYIDSMGSLNIIEVDGSGRYYMEESSSKNQKEVPLNDDTVSKIEGIEGVKAVMPIKRANMKMAVGKMIGYVNVIGIDPNIMEEFDFKIDRGRLLLPTDKEVMIFGSRVAFDFRNPRLRNDNDGFSDKPPVDLISNKMILTSDMDYGERRSNSEKDKDYKPPKPHEVKGVGILTESNDDKGWNAYMNMTSFKKILKEDAKFNRDNNRSREKSKDEYESLKVKVENIEQVEKVQEQLKGMGLQTYSLTDMLKSMKEQSRKMQAILGGIGAVSLLVAAIGITNTMIMSIYERTREIGVMKVLGANLPDIKKLFLIEAAMIGFVGGICGLVFSYLVSYGLNQIGGGFMGGMGGETGISVITPILSGSALIFSTIVGIVSGYLPARRAMNLSALEAIKTE
ncbi:ABC transporter permease [Inediibacterium massiliense]|uniref:ABC transporter permease n=1 Tax=Inediibacterium massiliense TaxID=1658111 RepID=UPI0006B3FDEF|nr:ABC transporter permease [Inediibacterium massiliense]